MIDMKNLFSHIAILFSFILFSAYINAAGVKAYKVGDRGPAGGWVFYDKGDTSGGWRYLEVSHQNLSSGIPWYNGVYVKTGASESGLGYGKINTKKIINTQGNGRYAAKICADYRGGDKDDWYLPSKEELDLIYENLYKSGLGNFDNYYYWSSTETNAHYVWARNFQSGKQYSFIKDKPYASIRVRAVRSF